MYKTVVKIDGMACGMCECHVNDAIRSTFDVKKVESSHKKKQAVIVSDSIPDTEKLKQVVSSLGYTVLDIRSEECEKKRFSLFGR